MTNVLSEEEMRRALFGTPGKVEKAFEEPKPVAQAKANANVARTRPAARSMGSKLQVTLKVSREFEGRTEIFTYDASTLSSIVAELEAKQAAKKKKFKYFELVSIKAV